MIARVLVLLGGCGVALGAMLPALGFVPGSAPRRTLRNVRLTQYWIAPLTEGTIPVLSLSGVPLAWVSADSMAALRMEGTGQLPDGRIVNYSDGKRWRLVEAGGFGYGVGNRKLLPQQSIAVDPSVIALGSLCYIPEARLWVRAVDVGDLIKGLHVDLFAGFKRDARQDLPERVTVEVYG